MRLNKLALRDKRIFAKYLRLSEHELAVYAFQNIYIWNKLFDICWVIIEDSLCIFFQDKLGCFLYFSPLAERLESEVIEKIFKIMDNFNRHPEISRIENVEKKDLSYYNELGYQYIQKSCDYLCRRQDLVQLKGNAFKSKRSSVNYFCKNYHFQYSPFQEKDKEDCLKLYALWARQRKKRKDIFYQGMIKDSLSSLEILLQNYDYLNCLGRVVKIEGEVKAFTFGFKLNSDTFCILYEIVDLTVGGLAQFIFRQFSSDLKDYQYINIMDDSGLENLRRVKLSYRPLKLIPAYMIKRQGTSFDSIEGRSGSQS